MILYIHGFGSCGDSNKTRLLKSYFGKDNVVSPDVPIEPDQAIRRLSEIIESEEITLLIGSSLGGFYATALAGLYEIDGVLINPSCHPYQTLAPYIGDNQYWCREETFEWKSDYLLQLARMAEQMSLPDVRMFVLLQTADEVLDYRIAAEIYGKYDVLIEAGGNHRFENLDVYLEQIKGFWKR